MRRERLILVPFAALAAILALASTAFACTFFQGTFTIKGNGSTTSVTATGSGKGMSYKSITTGIAKANPSGGSVTVSTGVDPKNAKNLLPAGAYYIRFYNSVYPGAPGFTNHTTWKTDCMYGSAGVPLGSGTVNVVGGKITGQPLTFPLPSALRADQAPAESAVCISNKSALNGNQAPLTIL